MKSNTFTAIAKTLLKGIFATTILMSLNSCATKAKFVTSSVVPAARGDVQVTQDKNKNYEIKIEISDLAEVERLQPPRQTYVVWVVSVKDETRNLGQLKSSSGSFSSNLKASFDAVTAYKPAKIFITAEDDATILYPTGVVVLSTDRF